MEKQKVDWKSLPKCSDISAKDKVVERCFGMGTYKRCLILKDTNFGLHKNCPFYTALSQFELDRIQYGGLREEQN